MNNFKERNIYFGDLHTHTGYSDGQLTPLDAFEHAKGEGQLDFLAVTDHAGRIDTEKFSKTLEAAHQCTTSTFLAIRGCENGFDECFNNEYGIPVVNGGELITFGADHTCCDCNGLDEFTKNLTNVPTAFAGFAHPQEAGWPTELLWNGYDMENHQTKEVMGFVKMIEVCNETSAYNQIHEKLYPTALDLGFHVSPIGVTDTHQTNWGSKELFARTAVVADILTEEAIFNGLKNQSCYATETGNTLFDFTVNDVPMGGTAMETEQYVFRISADEKECENEQKKLKLIEIISDYGNTIWSSSLDCFAFDTEVILKSNTARYFFVRIKNALGGRIWSSPIWTGRAFDPIETKEPIKKLDKDTCSIVSQSGTDNASKLCNNDPNDCCRFDASNGYVVIDLGEEKEISAIGYHRHRIPYEDRTEINALMNRYCYEVSLNGLDFEVVAKGMINNYGSEQIHRFTPVFARYIKINVLSCVGSDYGYPESKAAIGEISVYQ